MKEKILKNIDAYSIKELCQLGYEYLESDYEDQVFAKLLFEKAASMGDESAMFTLGVMWESGEGGPQDFTVAMEWYIKADEAGWFESPSAIGNLYAQGLGVEQDMEKAFEYFMRGVENDDERGYHNAGLCLLNGYGIAQDNVKAVELLSVAADKGFVPSIQLLTQYLSEIEDDDEDDEDDEDEDSEAIQEEFHKWVEEASIEQLMQAGKEYNEYPDIQSRCYKKAAELGNPDAMLLTGMNYLNGCGLDKNPVKAIEWFKKAAASGNKEATERLKK